jgi:hypothetical protein
VIKTGLKILVLTISLVAGQAQAQGARIIDWVESAPASDPDRIALGYPVPIRVNTPLPFAGFRTYAGLHMRHQDLAATTPWVHPHQIGTTRAGRTIWAYRLGDEDMATPDGFPEQAMLSNGGIHAREWQSPEVTTGIIELLADSPADNHLISYLRDNANIIVIPVLNIDGSLQTERYPTQSWRGTDPGDPEGSARDGRMRRKNMLSTDEVLNTQADHLNGVDLNRNNNPFWSNDPNRSSPNLNSIVHHGAGPASEPEILALDAAAQLGPADQLSMYTDIHSFSQLHFWVRSTNPDLWRLTENILRSFSEYHVSFPAQKRYTFTPGVNLSVGDGIGSTDEYFTYTYGIPAWTLEIEPTWGGSDYGGLGRTWQDGFILPDSEVPRVRTELAKTFAISYYQQSRPPAITAITVVDQATGAVVYESEWDPVSDTQRTLHTYQTQTLQLDRLYRVWMAHDKPMRWREDGEVIALPGQLDTSLDIEVAGLVDEEELNGFSGNLVWHDEPDFAPDGYVRYRDDAVSFDATLTADDDNLALIDGETAMVLSTSIKDFTNQRSDADPSTVSRWSNGLWIGHENDDGVDTNRGGHSLVPMQITDEVLPDPFVVEAGTSSAWFDPSRNGEGFVLEIIPGNRAIMYWFTYDGDGEQDWYIAVGEVRGNRVLFPAVLQVSGGVFGPDFDPALITETVVGSATFIWEGCNKGTMKWQIGSQRDRMALQRLSRVMGIDCGNVSLPPVVQQALLSGSWYDPTHNGEGYTLEVLVDGRVLVYWFGFGPDGARRWFFGIGSINGNVLEFPDMLTTRGGVFGAEFNPAQVETLDWGSLELEMNCEDGGEARFTPTEEGFPAGTLNIINLSSLDGLDC